MFVLGEARALWVAVLFLLVSFGTRIGLAVFSAEHYAFAEWARLLFVGLLYDGAALTFILLPWMLYEAVRPFLVRMKWFAKVEAVWAVLWAGAFLSFFLGVAAAEFAFWGEFASRFDFIAVDYLVYTHEVIGNIQESYPVGLWLAGIFAVSLAFCRLTWPNRPASFRPLRVRLAQTGLLVVAAFAGFIGLDQDFAESAENAHVGQLSNNGLYALFHAYRFNELDYARYYPTLPEADLDRTIRRLLKQRNTRFLNANGIDREVEPAHPLREVNLVLISVESLSAEFLGAFGNSQNLTPELDALAKAGLSFTNLYATGTRTVRGLEALSLGTPPTPGQSIVRRPGNQGLENLGEELGENGWQSFWIYGGYGFFDNMNAYFGANGYTVVDRADLADAGIEPHHENVWGVADEDLFSLALAKLDQTHAQGDRFFAHVMTTSNHRPYTFPEDRIDLEQGHREGAVKYTDWAIGDFIRRARSRPWFDNTLFVIVADHTAKASGKTDLPPSRYHIPMIWYAPALLEAGEMPRLMSQIDVPPTLLGWLGVPYDSRFMGYDMAVLEEGRERAFISTYQKLGYLKAGKLVELDVKRQPVVVDDAAALTETGTAARQNVPADSDLIEEAVAWYQSASDLFRTGALQDIAD